MCFLVGKYLNYNLNDFFSTYYAKPAINAYDTSFTIQADPFLYTIEYKSYVKYKEERLHIKQATQNKELLDDAYIIKFIALNPGYFESYVLAGNYYAAIGDSEKALHFFNYALHKEFEKESQRQDVLEKIQTLQHTR